MTERPRNRLADAASPYLLSHALNPVDWYPWGEQALARARAEDKPIFLSVGYAACHWCHVMERESFEDEEVAAALRESFVSIKVDREERPDVDQLYMAATMAMTGGGGWPMTVFMTPSGRPFFAGTYFPKTTKHGRPGFLDLVRRVGELWRQKREDVEKQAETLVAAIADEAAGTKPAAIPASVEDAAVRSLLASFDPERGGFGGAPKFPAPFTLELLLLRATRDERAREAVVTTLDRMARGGIYDHVGGGFARYSTDVEWHVPHFEKMLYDNAQLVRVYSRAAVALDEPRFAHVARHTATYLRREMQAEGGGFYSATDADSEGVEGKYFVWSLAEWRQVLGDDANVLADLFDVTEAGNWEGHNVLRMKAPAADVARRHGLTDAALAEVVERGRESLLARRGLRVAPLLDDKVLAGWNGLAISALSTVGFLLDEPDALSSAEASARFVLAELRSSDGGLLRAHRAGRSHIPGFLEDYAFFCEGLIDLYEATGRYEWLRESLRLAERAAIAFGSDQGFFFNTSKDHDALVLRMHEGTDGATASPNAVFARVLARLGAHFGRTDLLERAREALLAFGRQVARVPRAFLTTLDVARRLREPLVEVALRASPGAAGPLLAVLRRRFLSIGALAQGEDSPHPLLSGRPIPADGALAYVCRQQSCDAPTSDPAELDLALSRPAPVRGEVAPTRLAGAASGEATRAFVGTGTTLGAWTVATPAVVVGGFLEPDVHQTIETALAKKLQTFVFDLPRAEPTGTALRKAVESGVSREALVLVALLGNHDPEAARELVERLGTHLDVALVPAEAASAAASWEATTPLRDALPGTRLGLWLKAPLTRDSADLLLRGAKPALVDGAALVAAPFNVVEGDPSALAALVEARLPFLALRALECRFSPHVANLLDRTPPMENAPASTDALVALEALEDEYRRRIAVRLSTASADADPKRLLSFAEDLRRAEDALDDVAEVEAFVHEQLGRNVAAAWEALAGIGGELGEQIQELRERYLGALDLALRALAQRVLERQAALAAQVSETLGVARDALPEEALARVVATPGVSLAAVTVRKAEDLAALAWPRA